LKERNGFSEKRKVHIAFLFPMQVQKKASKKLLTIKSETAAGKQSVRIVQEGGRLITEVTSPLCKLSKKSGRIEIRLLNL
jgi:hypothetical protein